MKTPILDFVSRYAAAAPARFHMPGHKGNGSTLLEARDITEVQGADVLYSPTGIVAESEENATALFGTAHTYYSAEGATLAIKAMLGIVARGLPRGKRAHILAGRNAHKAFLFGAALLDCDVTWLYPAEAHHLCACPVTAENVENAIKRCEKKPDAVYITSPDYLGNVADVAGIAAVCDKYEIPLLVDNAHGAYLRFLPEDIHPITLGASMCADSAHKTLAALTGAAYLHISKKAPERYLKDARGTLSLFASTSPSYLILQSLDACNPSLAEDYPTRLAALAARMAALRARLRGKGFSLMGEEPLKLVINAAKVGYSGQELGDLLRGASIEPEMADDTAVVLMCSPYNTEADLAALENVLYSLPLRAPLPEQPLNLNIRPVAALSLREALLSPAECVPPEDAVGRICALPCVSCPPAVPVVVAGERIDESAVLPLRLYGGDTVQVVIE